MSARILVIEDDEGITRFLRRGLAYEGYTVDVANDGQMGLIAARDTPPDLVVLDLMLPGIDGLETYKSILKLHPGQKAIIASGYSETDRVQEAHNLGASQYVRKPYSLNKIGSAVKAELRKKTEQHAHFSSPA